jgi:hypothetical protein
MNYCDMNSASLRKAISCLAAAMSTASPNTAKNICTAVANLIAGSGSYGSTAQTEMMRVAEETGLICSFYPGNSIYVNWVCETTSYNLDA